MKRRNAAHPLSLEHEKRGAIWILGLSIARTVVSERFWGTDESHEYRPVSAAEDKGERSNAVSGQSFKEDPA
jgi:hypothetical protein